ncbi:MAG: PKD repeat protein [Chitinophagales bacterium]|jgi:PKD repeat protein
MRPLITYALSCLFLLSANAQAGHGEPCSFEIVNSAEESSAVNDLILNYIQSNSNSLKSGSTDIRIIPIVIHVIHDGASSNISIAQIESQIQVLNEDFGKIEFSNGDGSGVDTRVRFCLAQLDPGGNCTNGIVRIQTPLANHYAVQRGKLKELSFWDNTKYLNIYVVKSISGNVAGYASFPGGPANEDGIVVQQNYFGTTGTANGLGRTPTHEVGHWLGLYHTFNNGCGQDLCLDGDYVCDTPPADSPNYACPSNSNSCNNDFPDLNDQIQNYMDYSNDACQDMFSQGQSDRMHATLDTIRTVIWSSSNIIATGCDSTYTPPFACPIVADFVTLNSEICIGNEVYFMDRSLNEATSWNWLFTGGSPNTSTDKNPTITYSSLGTFPVSLTVSNANFTDTKTINGYIVVNPPGLGESLSVGENFDWSYYPPLLFDITNFDGGLTWELDSQAFYSAPNSIKINNLINTNYGTIDELNFPELNLNSGHVDSSIYLSFKWAYAKSDVTFTDELYVMLSTDCGVNFDEIFYGAGNAFATGPVQSTTFIPDSSQWDSVRINLDSYRLEQNVQVKFVNVTDGGNCLYLDDIYLGDGSEAKAPIIPTGLSNIATLDAEILIYPNPSNNLLNIKSESELESVQVFQYNGKETLKINHISTKEMNLDLSQCSNGAYLLVIKNKEGIQYSKVLVQH